MNTTFQSSATTSYHEHYNINLDINKFNFLLNEKWLNEEFDVISDLPKDINPEKIIKILDNENLENCSSNLWISWTNKFKEQLSDVSTFQIEDINFEIGEPIDTIGGAILKTSNGDIEVNNTIEARLDRFKSLLRSEVAEILFK